MSNTNSVFNNSREDHLSMLIGQIEALVAESACDFAIAGNYCLTRDGRWMHNDCWADDFWTEASVEEVVADLGAPKSIEEIERFLVAEQTFTAAASSSPS